MEIEIRRPNRDDIPMIEQFYSKWWVDEGGEKEIENIAFFTNLVLENTKDAGSAEKYFIATNADSELVAILGYAESVSSALHEYVSTERPIQLTVLMVGKNFVGRGIGTELLAHFEAYALTHGYTEILLTSSERWKDAWTFYRLKAYEDRGELKNAQGWHTRIFRKPLSQ